MITFIFAVCAIAVIAASMHTTLVYCALFTCGAIALPCCTALNLTLYVLACWALIEVALYVRNQFAGTRIYWQFGNFQMALAM